MRYILTSNSYTVAKSWSTKFGIRPATMTVAFIDTAAHREGQPPAVWLEEDRNALTELGFHVTVYTLIGKTRAQLIDDLSNFDIIFVSGGNTFYLLEHANRSGFSELIREDYFKDKIYVGSSAGSVLLSYDIDAIQFLDDPTQASLESTKALGIVNFVIFPHWGSAKFKTRYEQTTTYAYENKIRTLTIPDNAYITLANGTLEYITIE